MRIPIRRYKIAANWKAENIQRPKVPYCQNFDWFSFEISFNH